MNNTHNSANGATAPINKINLWYQTFGTPSDPALLLIAGHGANALFWPDAFCQALADGNRFVIRYDHRDTGLSSSVDFEQNPYDLIDMARDALGLLDALGIDKAHMVGSSLGGFIAQLVALHWPERALSLTTIMSTSGLHQTDLPGMKQEFLDAWTAIDPKLDEVDLMIARFQAGSGPKAHVDRAYWLAQTQGILNHAPGRQPSPNHHLATAKTELKDLRPELHKLVDMPTLVIQGSEEPIFPGHGQVTAKAIPQAQLLEIEGMGHALAPQFFAPIVQAILAL